MDSRNAGGDRVSSGKRHTREETMRGLFALSSPSCLALLRRAAHAQPYPSKPITIVVPFAAGSGTDSITRIVAQYLQTALGPERRGREQGRRERRDCGDLRGARGARRLHAPDGDELDALRQSASVQEARLRSREGLRAGRSPRLLRVHAGGEQGRSGEDAARACRLREGQSRQAHLRERQHHRHRGGRDVQEQSRRRHPARAIQEHAARDQ